MCMASSGRSGLVDAKMRGQTTPLTEQMTAKPTPASPAPAAPAAPAPANPNPNPTPSSGGGGGGSGGGSNGSGGGATPSVYSPNNTDIIGSIVAGNSNAAPVGNTPLRRIMGG